MDMIIENAHYTIKKSRIKLYEYLDTKNVKIYVGPHFLVSNPSHLTRPSRKSTLSGSHPQEFFHTALVQKILIQHQLVCPEHG